MKRSKDFLVIMKGYLQIYELARSGLDKSPIADLIRLKLAKSLANLSPKEEKSITQLISDLTEVAKI